MSIYGNVGQYQEENECFTDYVDRFDAFLLANEIQDDRKSSLFLATIGPESYKLLKNICAPTKPSEKTYPQLIKILKDHYHPEPIVIAERHKFWSAHQGENESVAEYIVRLKKLASTCSFGTFLDDALRDRLVSGLHTKLIRTQKQLLTVRDLTFSTAKNRCIADEMANKASLDYPSIASPHETNRLGLSLAVNRPKSTSPWGGRGKPNGGRLPENRIQGGLCKCCGANHLSEECKFRNSICYGCQKKGHLRSVCRNKYGKSRPTSGKSNQQSTVYSVQSCSMDSSRPRPTLTEEWCEDSEEPADICEEAFGLYSLNSIEEHPGKEPFWVQVKIKGKTLLMELDCGASRSTVSEYMYNKLLGEFPLYDCKIKLLSYVGDNVPIIGCVQVPVTYKNNRECWLELVVVKGRRQSLFGRDWMRAIKLDYEEIGLFNVYDCTAKGGTVKVPRSNLYPEEFNNLLERNCKLFSTTDTGIKEFKASIRLKPGARPVYRKSRTVPYSMTSIVEKEYDRLIKAGILFSVNNSHWASPTVHIPKSEGSVRVCGDYTEVNGLIENDGYKLPNCQELFARLAESGSPPKYFSVIDLLGAFNQVYLDEESAKILVLNTCKGLLGTNRLCYGIKTAPAQFQAIIDKILAGIDNVFIYFDDILVATNTLEGHFKVLKQIFERFQKFNVRINSSKCQFYKESVDYLGHKLSSDGIQPLFSKIDCILNAPTPTNVSELKSFLGMLNYYGKFLPNLSIEMQPLYRLLQHDVSWKWNNDCEKAFQQAKRMLSGDTVLVHYNPKLPLVLGVDASPYGLGAVLSHRLPDGSERPVAYASRTLSSAEKNYAHIEKEGLAIIFGIKKFHLYLYGRKFTLVTDHQPLTHIFGPKNGIPPLAAARMQRWATVLSGYDFDILYRSSKEHANADCLSRLPVKGFVEVHDDEVYSIHSVINTLPVTAHDVAKFTIKDSTLVKVLEFTLSGWPNYVNDPKIKPYWLRRHELSVEDSCLLWGRRVVIPDALQHVILTELHECHPGMCRMKALSRSFVWWPAIDDDIEDKVRQCEICINNQIAPKSVPLLLWPWCTEPWQRIHVDYLEIKGQQYLLIVDSHSKWMEVFPMSNTTATATTNILLCLFARYGYPKEVVSDNGPQFVAKEFGLFLKERCIKHTLCPPYHPSSNGLAERHVQTFKSMFLKYEGPQSLPVKLSEILFHYRNTPCSTTGKSPAELFLKREPRIKLSLIKPSLQSKVELKQTASKMFHDGQSPVMRSYDLYQRVRVRNMRGGREKWVPGTVVKINGPSTYIVRVAGNVRRFVHADHLRCDDSLEPPMFEEEITPVELTPIVTQAQSAVKGPIAASTPITTFTSSNPSSNVSCPVAESYTETHSSGYSPSRTHTGSVPDQSLNSPSKVSRAGRIIKPPQRLNL